CLDPLSDLPPGIPATTLAALYRRRWSLETAFQHVEKHFKSELETLAYPKAALFGFALALVAYNIFSVILAGLDCAHDKPVSEGVSGYYIAHEIAATFLALVHLGEGLDWGFIRRRLPARVRRLAARHRPARPAANPEEAFPRPEETQAESALRPEAAPSHVSTDQLLRSL
ncbi:MAG: hypothetical protein ACXWT9_20675, partial [Methylomagnum sp.]